jgi:hypothetical protein
VEAQTVQAAMAVIHGDLHCGNVLVKGTGDTAIIDFDDVGLGHVCADPIALELSLLFHPYAVETGLNKGLADAVTKWPDVDEFSKNSPFAKMMAACRDWSHDVGGGDRAVLAAGYAFALRQLKFETVERAVILDLLRAIVKKLTS